MPRLFVLTLVLLLLAACAPTTAQATIVPASTWTPAASETPSPRPPTPTAPAPAWEATTTPKVETTILKDVQVPEYLQNLKIITEAPKTMDELPRIQMADVRSGAFAKAILEQVTPFPAGADIMVPIPLSHGIPSAGWGPAMDLAGHVDVSYPGVYIGVSEDGKISALMPEVFPVKSGEGIFVNQYPLTGDSKTDLHRISMLVTNFMNKSKSSVAVPEIYDDVNKCVLASKGYEDGIPMCEAYVRNDMPTILELIQTWKKSGDFPERLATIPISSTKLSQ